MIAIIVIRVTTKIEGVVEEVDIIKGMIITTVDQALGTIEIVEGEGFPVTLFGIQQNIWFVACFGGRGTNSWSATVRNANNLHYSGNEISHSANPRPFFYYH